MVGLIQKEKVALRRDLFGAKPLFYYFDGKTFCSAETIHDILVQPGVQVDVNEGYIADLLTQGVLCNMQYNTDTYFKHVYQVEPGCEVTHADGRVISKRYWDINDYRTDEVKPEKYYIEGLRDRLHEAMKRCLADVDVLGCELSGGIDSSTVTCLAAQYHNNIKVFNHAVKQNDDFISEEKYAKIIADTHGLNDFTVYDGVGFDLLQSINDTVRTVGMPIPILFPVYARPIQRLAAKEGVQVMLSGFGGDECVSYQGARVLHRYAKQLRLFKLFKECRARVRVKGGDPYAAFFRYIIKAHWPGKRFKPTPDQVNLSDFDLTDDFIERNKERLKESFDKFMMVPFFKDNKDFYHQYLQGSDCWHIRARYMYTRLACPDIEYRYPLTDKDVVEFMMTVPEHVCFKNGYGRYLVREAMKGLMPDDIRLRNDKAGSPVPGALYYGHEQLKALGVDCSLERFDEKKFLFRKMLEVM